jgi:GDP/UDP-N,N'-diacetylbacillosamine 2-epimerase (hydrolysing)
VIKVAYVTGTRADFGLMESLLRAINNDRGLRLLLFPTGMHLMKEFGETINQVKEEFKITRIINVTYQNDNRLSMALFTSKCLQQTAIAFNHYKPDLVLILGDRGEQLAAACAATYLNIPIIHLHGGEFSGTVDNPVRHAISQLASFHFVATKKSAQHLINADIDPKNIFIVGAPGLKEIKRPTIRRKRQIVVLQHPAEFEKMAGEQIKITLKAVYSFALPTIIIYPNADPGGRTMIQIIKKFAKTHSFIKTYTSLPRDKFLNLLAQSSVLVGNSSAGIIEAPSLKLPVVNIGERQRKRERSNNVINVAYNIEQIKKAINQSL